MTDLRTAAQHALEALEADCGGRCNAEYNPCWQREVAETLRAALAEPVQEPFGYLWPTGRHPEFRFTQQKRDGVDGMPLYTAPPQRKPPATIDEMFDRMDKAPRGVFFGHDPMTIWMEAWRAAEQHHGIKEGT